MLLDEIHTMNLLSLDECKTHVDQLIRQEMENIKTHVNGESNEAAEQIREVEAEKQRQQVISAEEKEKRQRKRRQNDEPTRPGNNRRKKPPNNSQSSSESSSSESSSSEWQDSALTSALSACQKRNSETWIHIIQSGCRQSDHFVKMLDRLSLTK